MFPFIIEYLEVPFLFVGGVQIALYGRPADLERPDAISPALLKCPLHLHDDLAHKLFHSFDHDDKFIPLAVYETYIRLAEITAIQDEADMLISISFYLVQHELELRHVNYAGSVLVYEICSRRYDEASGGRG